MTSKPAAPKIALPKNKKIASEHKDNKKLGKSTAKSKTTDKIATVPVVHDSQLEEMRQDNRSEDSIDLSDSEWYLNRELTWLSFNSRVLHEAEDIRTPLLERLKFIAIVSANLDEFFMKRIGGLKQQIGASMRELTLDGRTPRQQVTECYAVVRELEERKEVLFTHVRSLLEDKNIFIEKYQNLTANEKNSSVKTITLIYSRC